MQVVGSDTHRAMRKAVHGEAVWCPPSSAKMGGGEPQPCRKCGRGTRSELLLCKDCGIDGAKKALHRAKARAWRLNPGVVHEVLVMARRMRKLPFVGL